jgi:hypothetical protein
VFEILLIFEHCLSARSAEQGECARANYREPNTAAQIAELSVSAT